jgi:two-component system alkaline phosphatase synthesis response regulator PhoP
MDPKGKKILIADDEPDILEILEYNLKREGFEVIRANNGEEALEKAKAHHPDLIILDVMMPKRSGLEVCEILRSQEAFRQTLIVVLTALSDEGSHINGLEKGADDFVSKPISPKVLISRVNALFRRAGGPRDEQSGTNQIIQVDQITIDASRFVVLVEGKEVILAKKEFELLFLLASRPGRVFLRNEILSQIWGNDVIVGDRTIDVHVRKVRQKMGIDCITTVKGVGYKFEIRP